MTAKEKEGLLVAYIALREHYTVHVLFNLRQKKFTIYNPVSSVRHNAWMTSQLAITKTVDSKVN